MLRARWLLVALVIVGLVGCGGDDSGRAADSAGSEVATEEPASSEATSRPSVSFEANAPLFISGSAHPIPVLIGSMPWVRRSDSLPMSRCSSSGAPVVGLEARVFDIGSNSGQPLLSWTATTDALCWASIRERLLLVEDPDRGLLVMTAVAFTDPDTVFSEILALSRSSSQSSSANRAE